MVFLWMSFTRGLNFSPFFTSVFIWLTIGLKLRIFRIFQKWEIIYCCKDKNSFNFFNDFMNISTHLMIDAIIIFAALTITLVLRSKGNASRKEKESKWLLKMEKQEFKKPKLFKIWKVFLWKSFTEGALSQPLLYFSIYLINNRSEIKNL